MDELLIRRAMKQDADAFTQLMKANMQTLYKTAFAILHSDDDAADAIQDAILGCWEHIDSLKEPAYFKTWMIRILVNKCYDRARKQQKIVLTDQIPDTPSRDQSYENAEWKLVLDKLDDIYRPVMILYYVNELKTSEIADILNITESTVRTRLSRGRQKLAEIYKDSSGERLDHGKAAGGYK